MTDNPIESVVIDGTAVGKASVRSWAKTRVRLRVTSVAEVNSNDYSDAFGLDLRGVLYDRDTTDTTTADNAGVTCIVDGSPSGMRFIRIAGATTIAANTVTLGMMAQIATATFLGRTTAATGNVEALTVTQATAMLNAMVGDSGSGGTKGLVPAAGAGAAAAGKYLKADGTFAVPPGSGGAGSLADIDRQNILLNRIYQAKAFVGYRRFLGALADGFTASDGVNAGSSTNYTVTTASGYITPTGGSPPTTTYVTGDRTATITVTTNITITGGTINNFVDGDFSANTAGSIDFNGAANTAGNYIRFDWGVGALKYFDEAKIYCATAPANDIWKWQYSVSDGTTWVDLNSFTWNTSTQTQAVTGMPSTGARYLRMIKVGTSGTMSNLYYEEFEFKTATGTSSSYNNMTLVTTAQTADASVSNARVFIEFDNTATPTLNTDLTVEVTCNGGTNWTSASLSSLGAGQGGRLVVETVDQACTAGTSFAARIKTLNNKNIPIYGVSLSVH